MPIFSTPDLTALEPLVVSGHGKLAIRHVADAALAAGDKLHRDLLSIAQHCLYLLAQGKLPAVAADYAREAVVSYRLPDTHERLSTYPVGTVTRYAVEAVYGVTAAEQEALLAVSAAAIAALRDLAPDGSDVEAVATSIVQRFVLPPEIAGSLTAWTWLAGALGLSQE